MEVINMWTHKCTVYNNVVSIDDDKHCHWCGLSSNNSEQLNNESISENKQFLQEINEYGQ